MFKIFSSNIFDLKKKISIFIFNGAGQDLWRWQSMNPTGFSNGTAS